MACGSDPCPDCERGVRGPSTISGGRAGCRRRSAGGRAWLGVRRRGRGRAGRRRWRCARGGSRRVVRGCWCAASDVPQTGRARAVLSTSNMFISSPLWAASAMARWRRASQASKPSKSALAPPASRQAVMRSRSAWVAMRAARAATWGSSSSRTCMISAGLVSAGAPSTLCVTASVRNVPRPTWRVIRPSCSRFSRARRTAERGADSCSTRARSVGSFDPGPRVPLSAP